MMTIITGTVMVSLHQYLPMIDPTIDVISALGFGIGMITAIYLREQRHEQLRYWVPFVAVAIVFGLLGAEGGALDPFAPGIIRIIALVILIIAELVGAFAVINPRTIPAAVP